MLYTISLSYYPNVTLPIIMFKYTTPLHTHTTIINKPTGILINIFSKNIYGHPLMFHLATIHKT